MVQGACGLIGITQPTVVIASTDPNVKTLLALANVEGAELIERHGWQETQVEASHTTLAAELQGVMATIAPGYNYLINQTFWDRTLTQPVLGPLTPTEWQALKAITATGPYASFRIQNKKLYAYPAPAAGNSWKFEYQTTYFCQSSGGADQSAWAVDTDVGVMDEALMKLGLVWRFKKTNGLDYAEDFRSYEEKLANKVARSGGKPVLNMSSSGSERGLYIPEGSWS